MRRLKRRAPNDDRTKVLPGSNQVFAEMLENRERFHGISISDTSGLLSCSWRSWRSADDGISLGAPGIGGSLSVYHKSQ